MRTLPVVAKPREHVPVKRRWARLTAVNSQEIGRSSEVLRLEWQGLVVLKGYSGQATARMTERSV